MSHSIPAALADLDTFGIEVPSWAYGNSGTRFKVFTTRGRRGIRGRRSPMPRRLMR